MKLVLALLFGIIITYGIGTALNQTVIQSHKTVKQNE